MSHYCYNIANWHIGVSVMMIMTRIFHLCDGKYRNLSELARAMELSVSQVYRVREGKRPINHKFIIGAKMAFPDYKLDDMFYFDYEYSARDEAGTIVTQSYRHLVQ